MTRELKLALIVGFSLVLVVMVLVSDHLSKARKIDLAPPANETALAPKVGAPAVDVLNNTNGTGTVGSGVGTLAGNTGTTAGGLTDPLTIKQGTDSPKTINEQTVSLKEAADRLMGIANKDTSKTGGLMVPTAAETASSLEPPAPVSSSIDTTRGVRAGGDGTVRSYANGTGASLGNLPMDPPVNSTGDKPIVASNDKIITIEAGQSLYGIAKQQYGNSKYWKQLLEYNKATLKSESALKIGMKIKVPDLATLTGKPADVVPPVLTKNDPAKTVKELAPAPKTGKGKTYTVVKGDTPGTIAKKALGSSKRAHELMNLNKIEDDGGLKIGMVLQLPE